MCCKLILNGDYRVKIFHPVIQSDENLAIFGMVLRQLRYLTVLRLSDRSHMEMLQSIAYTSLFREVKKQILLTLYRREGVGFSDCLDPLRTRTFCILRNSSSASLKAALTESGRSMLVNFL